MKGPPKTGAPRPVAAGQAQDTVSNSIARTARIGSTPAPDPIGAALAVTLTVAQLDALLQHAVDRALEQRETADAVSMDLPVTIERACVALDVSRQTLHRLRGRGLPTVMCGDSPRVILREAIAWIREQQEAQS